MYQKDAIRALEICGKGIYFLYTGFSHKICLMHSRYGIILGKRRISWMGREKNGIILDMRNGYRSAYHFFIISVLISFDVPQEIIR